MEYFRPCLGIEIRSWRLGVILDVTSIGENVGQQPELFDTLDPRTLCLPDLIVKQLLNIERSS